MRMKIDSEGIEINSYSGKIYKTMLSLEQEKLEQEKAELQEKEQKLKEKEFLQEHGVSEEQAVKIFDFIYKKHEGMGKNPKIGRSSLFSPKYTMKEKFETLESEVQETKKYSHKKGKENRKLSKEFYDLKQEVQQLRLSTIVSLVALGGLLVITFI